MHLPKSIPANQITVDESFDVHNEAARLGLSLLLKLPVPSITHEATGYKLKANDLILHEAGTTTVPRAGVPGWIDDDGNPVTEWHYWARVTSEAEGRTTTVWEGTISPSYERIELFPTSTPPTFTQARYAASVPGEA